MEKLPYVGLELPIQMHHRPYILIILAEPAGNLAHLLCLVVIPQHIPVNGCLPVSNVRIPFPKNQLFHFILKIIHHILHFCNIILRCLEHIHIIAPPFFDCRWVPSINDQMGAHSLTPIKKKYFTE